MSIQQVKYAIVNKDTGEIENNCSICSIGTIPTIEDFKVLEENLLDANHKIIQITRDEINSIDASIRKRDQDGKYEYGVKLDSQKMKREIKERELPEPIILPRRQP